MWSPVVRGVRIHAGLDGSNLHIKTDSIVGSGDVSAIWFYEGESNIGGFSIFFSANIITYMMGFCQDKSYHLFDTTLPTEQDKEWVIEKRGLRTIVYCNGRQVLSVTASVETCESTSFEMVMGRDVNQIEISSMWDVASDFIYIG